MTETFRVAVLDDYQRLSQTITDWSGLAESCEITVFDRPVPLDRAPEILAPFNAVCLLRERMAFPGSLIAQLPNLKLIAITGRYNRTLDAQAAAARGITISHTEWRGTGHYGTPELTWGLILSLARNIPYEATKMRRGGWQETVGIVLSGRTLGVLGLGRQGRQVARFGEAFGMEVLAWSHNLTAGAAAEVGATRVEKDELLSRSDVVSIHYVLGERSRGLIGRRELSLMRPTAFLVNTSRGPIVEEAALIEALTAKRIAGAALDVFNEEPLPDDHPLRSLPNTVLTPHLGYTVEEFFRVAYADTVENIAAYLKGEPIRVLDPDKNQSSPVRS